MSSVFPTHIVDYARDAFDIRLEANSRAMVFNADVEEIVKFLDIGTRPASGALDIPHTSVDPLR
jgi:hypothetical protein